MKIVIFNCSKKKAEKKIDRLCATLCFEAYHRVYVGDLPKRVLLQLISEMRSKVSRGVSVLILLESDRGLGGFKGITVGKSRRRWDLFVNQESSIDKDLAAKFDI